MPPSLRFAPDSWSELIKQAEAAYPFEGCGLLLGPYVIPVDSKPALQTSGAPGRLSSGDPGSSGVENSKLVTKIILLKNVLRDEGRGRFDFSFSPQDFMQAQMAAEKENLDVVGLYHTHPDHPPRPSKTDESQPMLSGWINVIASVHGGTFKEAKAWWRDDDSVSFTETPLI